MINEAKTHKGRCDFEIVTCNELQVTNSGGTYFFQQTLTTQNIDRTHKRYEDGSSSSSNTRECMYT